MTTKRNAWMKVQVIIGGERDMSRWPLKPFDSKEARVTAIQAKSIVQRTANSLQVEKSSVSDIITSLLLIVDANLLTWSRL